ncbi:MAG: outer membrane beta-barrel protein [Prolixibacteraceae bacterium]|nr:outer membrane beta-barrel protein [Prolixibacteraceae bacterium]
MNAISFVEFNGNTYAIKTNKPHYQLQLGYKLNKIIDLGVYLGYSKLFHEIDLPYDAEKGYYALTSDDGARYIFNFSPFYRYDSHAFSYGLKSDIHILPILFNKRIDRLDVYLVPSIGLVSESYRDVNNKIIRKPGFWAYGVGIGTNYYFTKHLGLFGEYHLGHFYNLRKSRWQAGVAFKF